jgi:hypothetical protein
MTPEIKKALDLALEALEPFSTPNWAGAGVDKANAAITAIRKARSAPVQEPVAKSFMVHLYNFGYKAGHHDTVEGRYIDICRQDMETYHLEDVSEWLQDMVYTTAAQPAVQEPVGYTDGDGRAWAVKWSGALPPNLTLFATPPAAQEWVGLTDEDKLTVRRMPWETLGDLMDNTEAKLKEKNNSGP